MLTLGIDIGSAASKAAVLRDGQTILSTALRSAGIGAGDAHMVLDDALRAAGCTRQEVAAVAVTGYGRNTFAGADYQISELSCHAKGAHLLDPQVRTLIDVGGQDAKVIRLDDHGRMLEFVMNDKCAAGTGRFMEVMAHVLGCAVQDLSALSLGQQSAAISSTCTVFAETEVISRLSAGVSRGRIAAGVHRSVAKRVAGLALRCGVLPQVMMSGGVAQNAALVQALSAELGAPISVSAYSQCCGALGAAVLAWEKSRKAG